MFCLCVPGNNVQIKISIGVTCVFINVDSVATRRHVRDWSIGHRELRNLQARRMAGFKPEWSRASPSVKNRKHVNRCKK